MTRVHRDSRLAQPCGLRAREHAIRLLARPVGRDAVVAMGMELNVGQVQPSGVGRGDVDHPRRRRRAQRTFQQAHEQVVGEHVHGPGQLDAVGALAARGAEDARTVHEQIQPRHALAGLVREAPHAVLAR